MRDQQLLQTVESRTASRQQRGILLMWVAALMPCFMLVAALAVDVGQLMLVESQVKDAADSLARTGAYALRSKADSEADNDANGTARHKSDQGLDEIMAAAIADHVIDGKPLTSNQVTWQTMHWNHQANASTPVPKTSPLANAVEVSIDLAGTNAVRLPLASFVGVGPKDVSVSSIAAADTVLVEIPVYVRANPWLAGMPTGTVANAINPYVGPDFAGTPGDAASPVHAGLTLRPGMELTFNSIDGSGHFSGGTNDGANADGHSHLIANNRYATGRINPADLAGERLGVANGGWRTYYTDGRGSEHGKSDLVAPFMAVTGVFLSGDQPVAGDEPEHLNFETEDARNFTVLAPKLNQPFFIGDGRNSDGDVQRFVVPDGATRLFMGVMDQAEWNNNVGHYQTSIGEWGGVSLVK